QPPFNGSSGLRGSFTFTASLPVSVIALRGFTNERSEFLITTLPVADLSAAASTDATLFPHLAVGGGWGTNILLVNTTDALMSGFVQFTLNPPSCVGVPLSACIPPPLGPQDYSIPARSSVQMSIGGTQAVATG